MKNDTGTLNELWSHLLIKELVHHGVRTFCIAPGARSTALTVAAHSHPLAKTIVHYDERGMAFHALGYSKGSGSPVALIVTSGTAVGNLFPALMEGHHDHVPLIVLSADRPPELRDCGANQTTDQLKIFSNFVRWEGELPCPDGKIAPNYVGTTVAQLMQHALSAPRGPVHLNCMFRKPFLSHKNSLSDTSGHTAQTSLTLGKNVLDPKSLQPIADELSEYERGVILANGCILPENKEALYALAETLQWPLFPDLFSPIREQDQGENSIPYYDLILKAIGVHEDYAPEAILQIGDRFISSKLTDWIALKHPRMHCHVSPHLGRKDPTHSVTQRVQGTISSFVDGILPLLSKRPHSKWLESWKELNRLIEKGIASYFTEHSTLSEPLLFHTLKDQLPPKVDLFFSNSMNVRNGDAFFIPSSPRGSCFGNRGLSGIDGNIATVAGIARATERPLVAFVGDLAFLHDLNSLPLLKNLPVKLIITNNNGGDIFHFLPTGKDKEPFIASHAHELKHAASLFDLPYKKPLSLEELTPLLKEKGPLLIEVGTLQGQNLAVHTGLLAHLQEISSYAATLHE